jgi:hypothetical protein
MWSKEDGKEKSAVTPKASDTLTLSQMRFCNKDNQEWIYCSCVKEKMTWLQDEEKNKKKKTMTSIHYQRTIISSLLHLLLYSWLVFLLSFTSPSTFAFITWMIRSGNLDQRERSKSPQHHLLPPLLQRLSLVFQGSKDENKRERSQKTLQSFSSISSWRISSSPRASYSYSAVSSNICLLVSLEGEREIRTWLRKQEEIINATWKTPLTMVMMDHTLLFLCDSLRLHVEENCCPLCSCLPPSILESCFQEEFLCCIVSCSWNPCLVLSFLFLNLDLAGVREQFVMGISISLLLVIYYSPFPPPLLYFCCLLPKCIAIILFVRQTKHKENTDNT